MGADGRVCLLFILFVLVAFDCCLRYLCQCSLANKFCRKCFSSRMIKQIVHGIFNYNNWPIVDKRNKVHKVSKPHSNQLLEAYRSFLMLLDDFQRPFKKVTKEFSSSIEQWPLSLYTIIFLSIFF